MFKNEKSEKRKIKNKEKVQNIQINGIQIGIVSINPFKHVNECII